MDSVSPAAGSVSRVVLELEVMNKGTSTFELVRHLAPITSRSIITNLPLQGRAHRYGIDFVYFETGLVIGAEKQRNSFKRGEAGVLVSNGSICIFVRDSSAQAMNPIGRVTGSLDCIDSVAPGDVIKLKKLIA